MSLPAAEEALVKPFQRERLRITAIPLSEIHEEAMPAEPPRSTVHQVQHLIFDGCRILRARAAESLAPETLAALDAMIGELQPIEGLPIVPVAARHYGLAHGLRTLVQDIVPYLQPGPYDGDTPVDGSEFVSTLTRVESELKALYEKAVAGA
jgi:hypothetical protein